MGFLEAAVTVVAICIVAAWLAELARGGGR